MILRLRQLCCHPNLILVGVLLYSDPFWGFIHSLAVFVCEVSSRRIRRPDITRERRERQGSCTREESDGPGVGRAIKEEVGISPPAKAVNAMTMRVIGH
jgi:hypothetical protein